MAFWGYEIKPGKPFTLPSGDSFSRLRITQAVLGIGSSDKSSLVQCNVGRKSPVLLCALLPGKAESIHLQLDFQEAEDVTFSVIGPRSVHLTGYFVGKQPLPGDDESESYGEDIGASDTDASAELSDDDEYGGSFIDDAEPTYFPPSPCEKARKGKKKAGQQKSTRKRLQKKYIELSESEDDSITSLKKHSRKSFVVESDEDDLKPISSLRESVKLGCEASKSSSSKVDGVAERATSDHQYDDGKVMSKELENTGGEATNDCQADDKTVTTMELDDVAGQVTQADERKETTKKLDNAFEQAEGKLDDVVIDKKVKKTKKQDDVPEKETGDCLSNDKKAKKTKKQDDVADKETGDCLSNDKKVKKRKQQQEIEDDGQFNEHKVEKRKKRDDVAEQTTDDHEADDRKVKRKKRKERKNESQVDPEKSSSVGKNEADSLVKEDGGLVIEDLKIGEEDGKVASSGKKVTIHYTGSLKEGGHVIDSTVGKSPLKLRLGKDAALDGLHLGIDGMRAGGKRKIIIPPELGYGKKGSDGVPPNAWLVMEVELLRVR